MAKVVDLQLLHTPSVIANPVAGGFFALAPYFCGVGDTGSIREGQAMGAVGSDFAATGVMTATTGTVRGGTRTIRTIQIIDKLGGSFPHPFINVFLGNGTTGVQLGSPYQRRTPMQQWALRAIVRVPSTSLNSTTPIFYLYNNNVLRTYNPACWADANFTYWGLNGPGNTLNSNMIGGNIAGSNYYRIELQCDNTQAAANRKMAMRVYQDDGTAPLGNQVAFITGAAPFTAADMSIDQIRFGDVNTRAWPGFDNIWELAELEVWDTRNGVDAANPGGVFSDQWDTAAGGVFEETASNAGARRSATYSIPAAFTTPNDSTSPPVPLVGGSTQFENVAYGDKVAATVPEGTQGTAFCLYLPGDAASAPAEGYPLVMWFHGGYGTSGHMIGTNGGLPANFRNRLLNLGYAVGTYNYVRASVETTIGLYGANDGRSVPGYGSLESMICNAKTAIIQMKHKGRTVSGVTPEGITGDGTYPIDANNIMLSGGSFGGWLALAAATSFGITDTGASNINLTLAGNPTFAVRAGAGAWGGSDPVVQGVFAVVPPDDLSVVYQTDLTDGLVTGTTRWPPFRSDGVAQVAVAGLADASLKGVRRVANNGVYPGNAIFAELSISNFASINSAILPQLPIATLSGTADVLVTPAHKASLDTALATASRFTSFSSPANHDYGMEVMPWTGTGNVEEWITATLSGAPAGPGNKFPTVPSIPTLPSIPARGA